MIDCIWEGALKKPDGTNERVRLFKGLSLSKCLGVQMEWTKHFLEQFEAYNASFPAKTSNEFLQECNAEDSHWQWAKKAVALNSDEYIWFSIETTQSIECLMVVYHPHKARATDADIFYVDYLAVAPWNRTNVLQQANITKLGTTMLKVVGSYLDNELNYSEGFSLHSLPKALPFYLKLGMKDFGPDYDKEDLHYLEMPREVAEVFYNV